eukprot:Lithocolla_globosa_v1_NODE_5989_length_1153_cov_3.866120.p2 type:complete len:104 gc:universal NODE_5989_length_1153_cov_3.866120:703-1014(+)
MTNSRASTSIPVSPNVETASNKVKGIGVAFKCFFNRKTYALSRPMFLDSSPTSLCLVAIFGSTWSRDLVRINRNWRAQRLAHGVMGFSPIRMAKCGVGPIIWF